MNALEIRCAYAQGLILEQIHGTDSEITQDFMLDVHDSLLELGQRDFRAGLEQVPIMLADSPCLAAVWKMSHRNGECSTNFDERL